MSERCDARGGLFAVVGGVESHTVRHARQSARRRDGRWYNIRLDSTGRDGTSRADVDVDVGVCVCVCMYMYVYTVYACACGRVVRAERIMQME
jgi:hypothetical protein